MSDPSGDTTILAHRDRQNMLAAASQEILAKLDREQREPNAEEERAVSENSAEIDRLEGLIATRAQALAQINRLAAPTGRKTEPDTTVTDPARPRASVVTPSSHPANFGFGHFGEFANAVRRVSLGGERDSRLNMAAAATISQEGVGPDGGYAVPPEFRARIMERVFGPASLLSRTDQQIASSNQLTFPADMTTPWQSTGGIQAYWEGEAAAIAQSKVALETVSVRLHKLAAIVPVTEELLEDAAALGGYVERKAAQKIDYKVSHAIVWGSGVGQPLGYMNAPALVTVAAEAAQTADTINATNIAKMWSRMPAENRPTSGWLIHPDAEPQLIGMTIGNQPIYVPPGGFSQSPYGSLMGRPVLPHEVCETVGDLGDVQLVDLAAYLTATKGGGIKAATSVHLWFDQDLIAFKFTFRLAGQPWWSGAISPRDGSSTRSPFVTLAAR